MKSIRNLTRSPIAVALPRGKKLRLGPLKVGEIADGAADHPPLVKMVEAGKLEVMDSTAAQAGRGGGSGVAAGSSPGHIPGAQAYRSGDR